MFLGERVCHDDIRALFHFMSDTLLVIDIYLYYSTYNRLNYNTLHHIIETFTA